MLTMQRKEPSKILLQSKLSNTGELIVVESQKDVPFAVSRLFFINEKAAVERGQHAQIRCTQALICVRGSIEVTCQIGRDSRKWLLDSSDQCLIIPPMVWASQQYVHPNSTLLVLCDRPYEESDYIRDFDQYILKAT